MKEDKLNYLAILHIEVEILNSDKMEIDDFLIDELFAIMIRRQPI